MSGYKKNETKYLHLYCNLFNYEGVPDLCRFSQSEGHQVHNSYFISIFLSYIQTELLLSKFNYFN